MKEMKFSEYRKTLPLAREIYNSIYPEHTTHTQWAESFNKVSKINNIIINHEDNKGV